MTTGRRIDMAAAASEVSAVLGREAHARRVQMSVLAAAESTEWWRGAACSAMPLRVFYDPAQTDQALAVCSGCAVRPACLRAAFDEEASVTSVPRDAHRMVFGVRGGTTAAERAEVLAQRLCDAAEDAASAQITRWTAA